jgi:hypothetical protein
MIWWRNNLPFKLLPKFTRILEIDIAAPAFLGWPMRLKVSLALAALLSVAPALAQTDTADAPRPGKTPTQLPTPKAEPDNPNAYAAPAGREDEGPSEADIGPVLKHFVRASQTDDLALTQHSDNASLAVHEKTALDKHISIPLIHDVQNDGPSSKTSGNHALNYEVTYLNWGAVTGEQFDARRGHYFTITWANHGEKSDFTARFEYRQVKSKEVIRTLSQKMPEVAGTVRSYFAVVDKAYIAYGPVVSWRFSILRGDTVVAEAKSFIW